MFDFKFDWDESISVGIKEIDDQHKELFKIARDIEQMVLIKCHGVTSGKVIQVLAELREYATYHFYSEEVLISKMNPQHLETHKEKHENFRRVILALNDGELKKCPNEILIEIRAFLKSWLFEHIVIEDKKAFK